MEHLKRKIEDLIVKSCQTQITETVMARNEEEVLDIAEIIFSRSDHQHTITNPNKPGILFTGLGWFLRVVKESK